MACKSSPHRAAFQIVAQTSLYCLTLAKEHLAQFNHVGQFDMFAGLKMAWGKREARQSALFLGQGEGSFHSLH